MTIARNANGAGNSIATYSSVPPSTINLSVTTANSGPLQPWTAYRIWSSVDAFFALGGNSVSANTSSHPIKAGLDTLHLTDGDNLYIAGIVASGTGVLYISQIAVGPIGGAWQ